LIQRRSISFAVSRSSNPFRAILSLVSDNDPDAPQTTPADTEMPKDDGAFSAMQRRLDGKPVLIYGTLIGGAIALLLLLMIVWLSNRDSGSQVNLCLDTTVAEAQQTIIEGGVRRIDVLIDAEQPVEGLTAIQLELEDGECRKLPEGADNRAALLQILGLVELYNQEGDGNVRVEYQRETIPPNLLVTSTPVRTETPATEEASPIPATPVPVLDTATATRTSEPTRTPTRVPTNTPVPATPTTAASPAA